MAAIVSVDSRRGLKIRAAIVSIDSRRGLKIRAAIVSVDSRRGLTITVHRRNQSNKSKLVHLNLLLSFSQSIKQLYISNEIEHFSYSGGCGMMHIKAFKEELV